MKEIALFNTEMVALVDDEDYLLLSTYKWRVYLHGRNYYAHTSIKSKSVPMHRMVMKVTDSKLWVDHRNRNGLHNYKSNLRIVTPAQSACNRSSQLRSNSKYMGVCWKKSRNRFYAQIGKDGKQMFIGTFKSEIEAAKAYDEAAKKIHGEYANLNFKQ